MSLLSRLMPNICSRLRIFICYSREDRELAREIGQSLTNAGHDVFIDANSLRVASDFNAVIRRAIARADRFVFLASGHSIAPRAYPQTELGFAEKRWPSPKAAVWPVIVDPAIDPAALPTYLRSVQVFLPRGDIVADLVASIDASRRVRVSYLLAAMGGAAMAVAALALLATARFPQVALPPPQQVDFRPDVKPGPDADWTAARVALTLVPVTYSNEGGGTVRILDETVSLPVGDPPTRFVWHNEVEMRANCGEDWLCTKTSVGAGTLAPQATLRRETMFMPAQATPLTWKDFVGFVCRSTADTLDVALTASLQTSGLLGPARETRATRCLVDLKALRGQLRGAGCLSPEAPLPVRLSPMCRP